MHQSRVLFVAAMVACTAAGAIVGGCSDDTNPKSCPQCGPGTACNPATGQCAPVASGCSAAQPGACGANAECTLAVCSCSSGFVDCNGDLGQATGNGCECNATCSGGTCGAGSCSPTAAGSCGGSTSFCSGGACQPCAAGTFNCDGIDACESNAVCTPPAQCDAATPNACLGQTAYCDGATGCKPCPAGMHNCDGIGECECAASCTGTTCAAPPPSCVKECTDFLPTHCVKNAAANDRCEECLVDSDCTANPSARGTKCDTTDLAGTGFNFCVCTDNQDCVGTNIGDKCIAGQGGADPKIKQCSCETDADCTAPHSVCDGTLFKRCRKRCASSTDCTWAGAQGWCDTNTGKCSYGDF